MDYPNFNFGGEVFLHGSVMRAALFSQASKGGFQGTSAAMTHLGARYSPLNMTGVDRFAFCFP